MKGLFRKGLGWKLQKQFRRHAKHYFNARANELARSIRKRSPQGNWDDLDQTIPDERNKYDDPLEQVCHISLRILRCIDQLADKNDFEYLLAYGTLLGAVRHGGFIPWDDDIDIMMTVDDFDKFLDVSYKLPDSLKVIRMGKNFWKVMDRYSVISKDGERGVAVDIFLLEPSYDNPDAYSFINVHRVKYEDLEAKSLFPTKKLPFTDGYTFPGPADPDTILEQLYNDYMKLPPVEERVSPHLGAEMEFRLPNEDDPIHPL